MKTIFADILLHTYKTPQTAARKLLDLNLPFEVSIFALVGSISASIIVTFFLSGMQSIEVAPGFPTLGPLTLAVIVTVLTVLLVVGLVFAGKPFSGTGTFAQAATLVAWTQIVQLGLQLVQVIIGSVSLVIASLFGLAATVYMLWVLISFVNVLHNLNSVGKSIVVFLMAVVGIALVLSVLVTLSGFTPPQPH
ncbi:MAG: YIP1 family protein [Planktomarina sp.]